MIITKNFIAAVALSTNITAFAERFGKGSLVQAPHGIERIENLSVGDKVISCLSSEGRKCIEGEVADCIFNKGPALKIISSRNEIVLSYDQKLFLDEQWVTADELKIGDVLQGGLDVVENIEEIDEIDLYNIKVETKHSFYVNNFLVHNPNGPAGKGLQISSSSKDQKPLEVKERNRPTPLCGTYGDTPAWRRGDFNDYYVDGKYKRSDFKGCNDPSEGGCSIL